MAVTASPYGSVVSKAFNKEIEFDADTIKVALLGSGYTPSQSHDYFNDVSAFEISGTGYTAGGITLTSKTVTFTAGTGITVFDADNVVWSGSSLSARYAVVYVSTGTGSTSALIGLVDFGALKTSTSGTFTITWDPTTGVFFLTVS